MQLNIEIKECGTTKKRVWVLRTVSIRGFNRPVKVEYLWEETGREFEYVRADVEKQVVAWLRDKTPITGATDWILKAVWTVIL